MLTCTFERGIKASLRHVVVDAIVVKDDQILLVRRAPHLLEGGKFALPGGYVDRDEIIVDALKREVLEETGYSVTAVKLFKIIDAPYRGENDDRQNVTFIYVAMPVEKKQNGDNESTEILWSPLDTLPKKEQFAFDHLSIITDFIDRLKIPQNLPTTKK